MAEFVERNLFANPADWISNKSDSINKPQSAFFEASAAPGSMLVTNGLIEPWGGALVSSTAQPPVNSAGKLMNWIIWRFWFRFPGSTADNWARLESDLKVCVKSRPNSNTYIRNVANFSQQINRDTMQVQIDKDPPAWVNTGFIVDDLEPDVWHLMENRYTFDDTSLTFSYLSVQIDDQLFTIDPSFRNVPMTSTNWEKCRKLQLQNCGYAAKSSVLVEYRDGELAWSDAPLSQIPPASLRDQGERYSRVPMEYGQPFRGDWTAWSKPYEGWTDQDRDQDRHAPRK